MKRRIPAPILISVILTLVMTSCVGADEVKLTAIDSIAGDYFGYSVSISGDYAIAGAYYDDNNGSNSRSAYVYDILTQQTPAPTNLQNTTDNFWVNYTWQAGDGNFTDSYTVNINGMWTNGTTATFSNTTVGSGGWANITVWAWNSTGPFSEGCVSDEVQVPGVPTAAPDITSSAPESPVKDTYGTQTKFNVSVDQIVNVTWYSDEVSQHTNESVTEANYTFHAEFVGVHNVSAMAETANGKSMQAWVWNVAATASPTLTCTCGDICVNTSGWWRDGGVFNANATMPIQAAVDTAAAGETICVVAGNYTENVNVDKQLTLQGTGADAVTVTAADSDDHVFEVTADYVNISGFYASGATGYMDAGIYINSADHCNISDNTVSGDYYGIRLSHSSNNTLTSNTADSNNRGIYLYSSSSNTLTSNTADSNDYGIYLYSSSSNTLTSNTAYSNIHGIYMSSSSSNTLTSNTADSNDYGISLSSSSNTLANNTMSGNDYNFGVSGFSLPHYEQNIDASNTVDGKPIYYKVGQQDGSIPLDAGYVGIVNSTNITVTNLELTNNTQGVLFAYTENSRIENVTAYSNNRGIYLYSSSSNTLTSNTAYSNNYGIYLIFSSSSNLIYNNYFNNTNNAYDTENNIWNTTPAEGTNIIGGSWLGGNYWSDHAGADTTGDGLGDTLTPYSSSGTIQNGGDYHPLVMPGFATPTITSFAPESPVNDTCCIRTKFNVSVDQIVNVTWYLDEVSQHTNESVTEANYTFHAELVGVHNVSALAENANGKDMQMWVWNVTAETTPPAIVIDAPTQSHPILIAGGGQFYVNFTYTELYPKNYTTTIENATKVINSTTNDAPTGGTGMTVNASLYLNASTADGWYNVTVEMYDNSSNHHITHQNHSVEKGSYNASILQPENQTTEPGVNATYTLVITNTGSFAGTFTLAVTNHSGADVAALNLTTIANLAIGASQNVALNVTDTGAGTYNVTVNATSADAGSEVAETGYIMTTVRDPALALDNIDDIIRDWGIHFSVNHSVKVTDATASNVNVTYNVSWIDGCTFETINPDATEWCNQTRSNSTVQTITVRVDANTTTGSITNDTETFDITITRRAINITAGPITPHSVNPNTIFRINGSAEGGYGETFIGKVDLIKDGSIIDNKTITDGNVNFSRTEPAEGTFNFSLRFYNTSHYNNVTSSNATIYLVDDTPPSSSTSSGREGTYPPGWFETPTPTVTAVKTPTALAASAATTATAVPPGDGVTPTPTKRTDAANTTTPAAGTAKNGAPGFTAVFAIATMLAIAYAVMRRRS